MHDPELKVGFVLHHLKVFNLENHQALFFDRVVLRLCDWVVLIRLTLPDLFLRYVLFLLLVSCLDFLSFDSFEVPFGLGLVDHEFFLEKLLQRSRLQLLRPGQEQLILPTDFHLFDLLFLHFWTQVIHLPHQTLLPESVYLNKNKLTLSYRPILAISSELIRGGLSEKYRFSFESAFPAALSYKCFFTLGWILIFLCDSVLLMVFYFN